MDQVRSGERNRKDRGRDVWGCIKKISGYGSETMAQSTPDKSERWPSIARAGEEEPPGTVSFAGHTRAYHARVHREGSGRKAAGRRGSGGIMST